VKAANSMVMIARNEMDSSQEASCRMTIQVIDVESMKGFSTDGVQPVVLHQSDGLTTLLLCVEPGQSVGPCVMRAPVQYWVMAGSGQLHVADEQAELRSGSLVVVPPDLVRSIVAVEQMRLLAMQVPSR
jgi:mannose-6-phosphate isomerase-like protein (cupin superfamily)